METVAYASQPNHKGTSEPTLVACRLRNALTPACSLPPEILTTIFSYVIRRWFNSLTFRIHTEEWSQNKAQDWRPLVLHVCQRWRDVATSCSSLWRHINLDGPTLLFEDSIIKSRSQGLTVRTCNSWLGADPSPTVSSRVLENMTQITNVLARVVHLDLFLTSLEVLAPLVESDSMLSSLRTFKLNMFLERIREDEQQRALYILIGFHLLIDRMDCLHLLHLDIPWTLPLSSLPSSLHSLSLLEGTSGIPPMTVPDSVWSTLRHLNHLHLAPEYLSMRDEAGTMDLTFTQLESLEISDPSAENLISFMKMVHLPDRTTVCISPFPVLPSDAETLEALRSVVHPLIEPVKGSSGSMLFLKGFSCERVFLSDFRVHRLYPGEVEPNRLHPSRLRIHSSKPDNMDFIPLLVPPDLTSAFVDIHISVLNASLMGKTAHFLRTIAGTLPGYADEPFEVTTTPSRTWSLIRSSLRLRLTFMDGTENAKSFISALALNKSLPSFALQVAGHEERYYVPPSILTHIKDPSDWVTMLGGGEQEASLLKEVALESIMEIDSFVEALSFTNEIPNSFPCLESLSIKNVVFGEPDNLLRVLKERKEMDCPLKTLELNGCFGIDEDVVEELREVVEVVEHDEFYDRVGSEDWSDDEIL
ncbi:hypothetical protein DL96DRAFT_1247545 [Flagelloscypha sp. PMI_526]|nr:hypothetical protein DL96DRAFT_1247545 [Flagelloscypha sp. PMI_526]